MSAFDVHDLSGDREALDRAIAALLHQVNREWRLRQSLAIGSSAGTLLVGGVLAFTAHYFIGLVAVLAAIGMGSFGFAAGRKLEVEIETLALCRALFERLAESSDPAGPHALLIDLRSAVHAARHADARAGASIVDHWFSMTVPLADGTGLQLELSELVRGADASHAAGRRVARDYHVALFSGRSCAEESLVEAVISHVSAPSATRLEARVREGADAFGAAIQQLRSPHGEAALEAVRIEVKREPREAQHYNPRGRG